MYMCDSCGEIYEKLNEDYECSMCYGNLFEADECECGNYKETGEKFCNKCKKDILKKFREFMDTFTEEEREFINETYDGEWL